MDLGDRMKLYEMNEAARKLIPLLPIMVRLDGKSFSQYTKNMKRPYDERMSKLMAETTRFLAKETNSSMAYCQSDEISLTYYSEDIKKETFFNGRIQKLTSVLASMATAFFNLNYKNHFGESHPSLAFFDCRVWNVPTLMEGYNTFLFRELDATKNSITMAAQSFYSHKQLMNKNSSEKQEMLFAKSINWNDYPSFFKRGTYIQRRTVTRKFTTDELEKLPEKHEARKNPDLLVERQDFFYLEMPPLAKVINKVEVIYFGEEAKVENESPS